MSKWQHVYWVATLEPGSIALSVGAHNTHTGKNWTLSIDHNRYMYTLCSIGAVTSSPPLTVRMVDYIAQLSCFLPMVYKADPYLP